MLTKVVKVSNSPDDTFKIAYDISLQISAPVVVGLIGELGTGKTCFAKGFASGLGVKELITSPTFLGLSESYSGRIPFVHMDFYKKVVTKDLVEQFLKKGFVVLIEWVDNFEEIFKEKLNAPVNVLIEYLKDNEGNLLIEKRQITLFCESELILP